SCRWLGAGGGGRGRVAPVGVVDSAFSRRDAEEQRRRLVAAIRPASGLGTFPFLVLTTDNSGRWWALRDGDSVVEKRTTGLGYAADPDPPGSWTRRNGASAPPRLCVKRATRDTDRRNPAPTPPPTFTG